jgi:uncharacterized OsmC-like protein
MATCFLTILGIHAEHWASDLPRRPRVRRQAHDDHAPAPHREVLEVAITMPPGVPLEVRDRLVRAAEACPVKQSFHPDTEIVLNWKWE